VLSKEAARSQRINCNQATQSSVDGQAQDRWWVLGGKRSEKAKKRRAGSAAWSARVRSSSAAAPRCSDSSPVDVALLALNHLSNLQAMSDLHRSALHARIAKLPDLAALSVADDEDDEEAEAGDAIGALPGSGLGPPAMCVA
jgi:hypothetical protein